VASLVEELINVLNEEEKIYRQFLEYGEQKRQILIDADVPALEQLTSLEQQSSDTLLGLSNKQIQLLGDIATVLGKTQEKMTVTKLIECLASQPDVSSKLQDARDRLLDSAGKMQALNRQNEALLKQAMELAEFDITLFRSLRQAPETANYDRNAYNTGTLLGSSGFDAKQ
jgi:beta-mannanase